MIGSDAESTADDPTDDLPQRDVLVVGGGVAGLTAALFTARAGLDTLVVDGDESILRRNAHLENFPGFPGGVNPRLFADMLHTQATRNGVDLLEGHITSVERCSTGKQAAPGNGEHGDGSEGFVATAADGSRVRAARVVTASWADSDYLDPLGPATRTAGSKSFLEDDGHGRTNVEGLYAAGRLGERYHQAIVAAGNGAEVGITVIHDSQTPYYHDWVVPKGYFTDRGREVPPGCEEIDETERAARYAESRELIQEYFADEHDQHQRTHPSLVDDDLGRLQ